jgi:hypothetical protein
MTEQMLSADAIHNFNCVLHLSGIMAILRSQIGTQTQRASGVEMLILGTDSQLGNDDQSPGSRTVRRRRSGAVEKRTASPRPLPPATPLQDLVSILAGLTDLFASASEALSASSRFESQLLTIRTKAVAVRSKLLAWYSAQAPTIRPVTVSRFTQPYDLVFTDCKPLPCRTLYADSYVDRKLGHSK